jgi:hypothetical protein
MSLLDTASLIVTPNGYKAGTLYSVIPNTTLGDLSVTRATTATRVNSSGLIESVASNVPRLDYTNGSCPSILVEPQRTNLLTYSEQFNDASWISTATITANTTIAPDGNLSADTFTDSTNAFLDVRKVITITANSTNTASFFVKKTTGALTNYPGVAILLTGVSTRVDYGIINTTTGAVIRDSSSNINSITYSTQSYGDYWRVITTFTDNQSNLACTFILYPAISTNGTTINANAQGSNIFWGSQFEAGSYATSYIPTTSASVTRNADVIRKTGISSLIGQTEGTLFIDVDLTHNNKGTNEYLAQIWQDGTNRILLYRSTNGKIAAYLLKSGSEIYNFESSIVANGKHKIAFAYKSGDISFYIDGSGVSSSTSTFTAFSSMSNYDFGIHTANGSPEEIGDYPYSSAALWKTRLTNTQMQTLTSL